jgi:hypothetical protein
LPLLIPPASIPHIHLAAYYLLFSPKVKYALKKSALDKIAEIAYNIISQSRRGIF